MRLKKGILITVFVIMFIPLFQSIFLIITEEPLHGSFQSALCPNFSLDNWMHGEYQENDEAYVNENFGFRNTIVRLYNHFNFLVFKKAKANGVIVGKKNYLYEESYINAYYGEDYLGDDSIAHTVHRLKYISDNLDKLGKKLLIVFAAGKASFYPEYIPDRYKVKNINTNYKMFSKLALESKLNIIDFNRWFMDNKKTSKYPLYPQFGIHWSSYATILVADSIIKKIENLSNISMPHIKIDGVTMDQPHEEDYDIASGMNLMKRLLSFDLAYPKLDYSDTIHKNRPKVLVVSDSFYWGMFNVGISHSFKDDHFWYYNNLVFPQNGKKEIVASELNITEQLNNHDVFIIMATEATLNDFGWGFIEKVDSTFRSSTVNL